MKSTHGMPHSFDHCIWCGSGYPPAESSREHVLPEFLGATLTLSPRAVCIACNNRLNTELDQPLKLIFQPLITFFGVRSTKHGAAASARVHVAAGSEEVDAVMVPGGAIRHHAHVRRVHVQHGQEVLEEWMARPEEVDALLAERAKELEFIEIKQTPVALGPAHAHLRGKAGTLMRSAVRAGINLLALQSPDLLSLAQVVEAKRYVLGEAGALPDPDAQASRPLFQDGFQTSECRPEHLVLVRARPDGPALFEVRLFGDIFCRVSIADRWAGPRLDLSQPFVVAQK